MPVSGKHVRRHENVTEAVAMPIAQPKARMRLSMPPASPVRVPGAAAMVALLLGAMNMPSPTLNSASALMTP
jgi:hypothetical protein